MIGITQPRRVAAINLAERVAHEMGTTLGEEVGYRVRFQEQLSKKTQIKFLTDGMLLREAILDPELSRYAIIVLDEAHERTVNSDVLLAIVKGIAHRRKRQFPLRIVVMSATLEIPKFQKYFSDLEAVNTASVIKVEGRTFPIEVYHTLEP